jgi:hypothetical protein
MTQVERVFPRLDLESVARFDFTRSPRCRGMTDRYLRGADAGVDVERSSDGERGKKHAKLTSRRVSRVLGLGWRRKRIWSTTGQYHRYWEPTPNADCSLR